MSAPIDETRTVFVLRTGTKVCVLIAVPLLIAAIYFMLAPVIIKTSTGSVFGCGSALNPPSEAFPKNICGNLPDVNRYRAYAAAAAAVVTAVLGFVFFGVDRHEQRRQDLVAGPATAEEPVIDDAAATDGPVADETGDPAPLRRRRRWEEDAD